MYSRKYCWGEMVGGGREGYVKWTRFPRPGRRKSQVSGSRWSHWHRGNISQPGWPQSVRGAGRQDGRTDNPSRPSSLHGTPKRHGTPERKGVNFLELTLSPRSRLESQLQHLLAIWPWQVAQPPWTSLMIIAEMGIAMSPPRMVSKISVPMDAKCLAHYLGI